MYNSGLLYLFLGPFRVISYHSTLHLFTQIVIADQLGHPNVSTINLFTLKNRERQDC